VMETEAEAPVVEELHEFREKEPLTISKKRRK